MERIAIFIDGSNFYHGLKATFGKANIDFEKFAGKLCAGRSLVRTYYYNVPVNRPDGEQRYRDQQKFFAKLHGIPYMEVKLGRLVKRPSGMVEKGVDVKLAVDMLVMAFNNIYDTAILVSGDGDYDSVVYGAKNVGKHVENAYFSKGHSDQLKKACDKTILLDEDFLRGCWRP